jgi:hypothetical protein
MRHGEYTGGVGEHHRPRARRRRRRSCPAPVTVARVLPAPDASASRSKRLFDVEVGHSSAPVEATMWLCSSSNPDC